MDHQNNLQQPEGQREIPEQSSQVGAEKRQTFTDEEKLKLVAEICKFFLLFLSLYPLNVPGFLKEMRQYDHAHYGNKVNFLSVFIRKI